MRVAIFDPFSGISGDMTLGALLDVGLDPEWLRGLPQVLGLDGVQVHVREVLKCGIKCTKVDFEIPPQPHGRHLRQISEIVQRSPAPLSVKERADRAFLAIANVEAALHGTSVEKVHLHEVGAVDAILDVLGAIWGLSELGIERVYFGTVALGDGFVKAAHGVLPVPAPATLRLLEGHGVRPGPEGSGELTTPTGAALVAVLSDGPPPARYIPRRSGFGAGSRDLPGRPNALRLIIADEDAHSAGVAVESLVMLVTDVDDMPGEQVAHAAELLRRQGALDVTCTAVQMKKGRPGVRLEVLCAVADADRLEGVLFAATTTLGVRRMSLERHALARRELTVQLWGHPVRVKVASLPDGTQRSKAEYEDVRAVAEASGRSFSEVASLAISAAEAR
jgi:uncharacterized protein (TIGR00299 family) protein